MAAKEISMYMDVVYVVTAPMPVAPEGKAESNRWYHVRIWMGERRPDVLDLTESGLKRGIATPYSQGNKFLFGDTFVNPSEITGIRIIATAFRSKIYGTPDFESLTKYGQEVTYDFITTPAENIGEKVSKEDKVVGNPKKVFIVHGHDDGSKNELSSFLYRLGLTPIILHEQANEGRTVVEKFENYASDVGYAFILLTPDDVGGKDNTELKPRARQNVILELGYFMGKLGRDRVCGLYKEGIEIPSDVLGVLYLKYEDLKGRQFDIVQELGRAGYKINVGIDH